MAVFSRRVKRGRAAASFAGEELENGLEKVLHTRGAEPESLKTPRRPRLEPTGEIVAAPKDAVRAGVNKRL